jgi:hypothetical protein
MMTSELMFPELFAGTRRPYDSIVVLRDTLVDAQKCKVIALHSSYYQTQEMIDDINRTRDSIVMQSRAAYLPRPKGEEQKRGLIRFVTEYYISEASGLIVHRKNFMIREGRVSSMSALKLNLKTDVDDFERYLVRDFEVRH